MTRMAPAKYGTKNKNATGGDAATSSSTSGARPTPNSQEEIVKTNLTPSLVRWNLKHLEDTAPLSDHELEYVLDADDPIAVAARAHVLIAPADPVVAAVARRSSVDYDTAAEMLDSFMASLERAEGGAA